MYDPKAQRMGEPRWIYDSAGSGFGKCLSAKNLLNERQEGRQTTEKNNRQPWSNRMRDGQVESWMRARDVPR